MPRKAALVLGLLAALALPASAIAEPTAADKTNAAKECRAERGTTDASREAFAAKYGNFGDCVSQHARAEAAERRAAKRNAARACREERSADAAAFAAKYRNFGACVSSKAKKQKAKEDAADDQAAADATNAAQECAQERETVGEQAFADNYGTNANKRNAFGKCVSGKVAKGPIGGGS